MQCNRQVISVFLRTWWWLATFTRPSREWSIILHKGMVVVRYAVILCLRLACIWNVPSESPLVVLLSLPNDNSLLTWTIDSMLEPWYFAGLVYYSNMYWFPCLGSKGAQLYNYSYALQDDRIVILTQLKLHIMYNMKYDVTCDKAHHPYLIT